MTHSSRLIEMQAEHIEALEAELAELDARLGRKTKRRPVHTNFSGKHGSSSYAITQTQEALIRQLESELVQGYAELGEKISTSAANVARKPAFLNSRSTFAPRSKKARRSCPGICSTLPPWKPLR
ncbi:MAG TPA: hypothetical protein PKD09_16820 [Aggregatilinea sp.]|uniref:hypothetical protein n=1 Tax=Aggregatilinea sp. TaxID=2806333 RepID=UPI002D1D1657|nr:hypothetical protein [Aggregatilinea sp.]HML23320.1 hypothetical protein [Aggregatilinea sp.]